MWFRPEAGARAFPSAAARRPVPNPAIPMSRKDPKYAPPDLDDVEGLRDHYESIRERLLSQSELDIRHHLPNLVETLVEGSNEPETVRFLVGVSFTQEHTPLDYMLERVYAPEEVDFHRRDEMKLPVSQDHHYVQFAYPPDPQFDADALRAALLTSIEERLKTIEENDAAMTSGSSLSDLWADL